MNDFQALQPDDGEREISRISEIGPIVVAAFDAFRDSHPPYGLMSDGQAVTDFGMREFAELRVPLVDRGLLTSLFGDIPPGLTGHIQILNAYDVLAGGMFATLNNYLVREGYLDSSERGIGRVDSNRLISKANHKGAAFGFRVASQIVGRTARAFQLAGTERPTPIDLLDCIRRSPDAAIDFASLDNKTAQVIESAYDLSANYKFWELRSQYGVRAPLRFILDPNRSEPTLIADKFQESLDKIYKVRGAQPECCPMVMSASDEGVFPLVEVLNRASEIAADAPELFQADIDRWFPQAA